jgi:hypothetical protein
MAFEHRRSWHGITTPFLTWLSVYIFIFTKISPLFNLFAYIFIQSYVNSNLHVSTLYILFMDNIKSIKIYSGVTQLGTCFIYIYLFTIYDVNKYIYIYIWNKCLCGVSSNHVQILEFGFCWSLSVEWNPSTYQRKLSTQ